MPNSSAGIHRIHLMSRTSSRPSATPSASLCCQTTRRNRRCRRGEGGGGGEVEEGCCEGKGKQLSQVALWHPLSHPPTPTHTTHWTQQLNTRAHARVLPLKTSRHATGWRVQTTLHSQSEAREVISSPTDGRYFPACLNGAPCSLNDHQAECFSLQSLQRAGWKKNKLQQSNLCMHNSSDSKSTKNTLKIIHNIFLDQIQVIRFQCWCLALFLKKLFQCICFLKNHRSGQQIISSY